MEKVNNNKMFILVGMLLLILATTLVATFASFSFTGKGEKKNIVNTGTLMMELDSTHSLSLTDAAPTSVYVGRSSTPYTFVIRNTGSADAAYRIVLVDDDKAYEEDGCVDKKMPWGKLKYSLTKNGEVTNTANLEASGMTLDEGTIKTGDDTNTYELRIWIDSEAGTEVASLHFHPKLTLQAITEGRADFETGE